MVSDCKQDFILFTKSTMEIHEVASSGHISTCRYPWITLALTLVVNLTWLCNVNSANVPMKTLYDISDEVIVLDNNTFKHTVYGSQQTWFIQFYSSWCGHCVHFAPTWKAFAKDIKSWQMFAKVGAINCADKQNSKMCSKFIDVGFPTLRFFKALQTNGTGDISKGQRDVTNLRHALIDYMTKYMQEVLLPHCPMLSAVTVNQLMNWYSRNDKPGIKMVAVVFEDEESYTGREVILDMANRQDILVVRVLKQEVIGNGITAKWKVIEYPSLFILKEIGEPSEMLRSGSRESFYNVLQNYALQTSLKSGSKEKKSTGTVQSADSLNALAEKNGLSNGTKRSQHQGHQASHHIKNTVSRSVVYMQDLESTLIYSLEYEVNLQKLISGDAMSALKTYIAVLNKYFPGQSHVMNTLASLQRLLQTYTHVSNEEWSSMLQYLHSSEGSFLQNDVKWIGCQGSTSIYRGYPCGLWLLFHTLTVSHASMGGTSPGLDSKEVLHAMKGYIHYFFGCRECSDNFSKESLTLESSVRTLDESVLWLWQVHNQVNKRLTGELSEDPQYPKVQFPTHGDCETCRHLYTLGEWNTTNVLYYLKRIYGVSNIAVSSLGIESRKHGMDTAVKMDKISSYGSFSLGIDQTDISMCFLLYGLCLVLLLVIYVYVRKRRKRKLFKF